MWMVSPRQHKEGYWRSCAESDEGGGFHEGCQHEHASSHEAQRCIEASITIGYVTGFPDSDLDIARAAYESYCGHAEWKSLATGQPLPQWSDLKVGIKAGWLVAARAIKEMVRASFLESLNGKSD